MRDTGYNYVFNWSYEIWGSGTTSAPTGHTLSGAGATIARNTTAGQFKYGAASLALTRVGTDCFVYQDIDLIADEGPVGVWASRPVILGCWVRATVASRARLFVDDGVTTTYSSYHTGGSAFEFLTVSMTLGASPTRVRVAVQVDTGDTTAQFDGLTLVGSPATVKHALVSAVTDLGVAGELSPDDWNADHSLALTDSIPSGWRGRKALVVWMGSITQPQGNTSFFGPSLSAGNENEVSWSAPYKCIARNLHVNLNAVVGGAGQTVIVTLRTGEATDTALTTTISSGSSASADTTNEVAIAKNTLTSIKSVKSATTGTSFVKGSYEIEEVP